MQLCVYYNIKRAKIQDIYCKISKKRNESEVKTDKIDKKDRYKVRKNVEYIATVIS